MRRPLVAISTALLLVSGCKFSEVKADATVHISGRALSASGAPLAGVDVRLFKEADLGEALSGVVVALASLGTVCLLPDPPALCQRAHTATTDSSGRYTFTLKGADVQGTLGTESTLDLVVAGHGANGPSTAITFPARSARMTLPDARLWSAKPRESTSHGQVRIGWSPLPGAAGPSAKYVAELSDPQHGAQLWSQPAAQTSATIDARVLEDQPANAGVTARTDLDGATGTDDVHAAYASARVPVQPVSGAPPSRGDACLALSGKGQRLTTTRQSRCGVTDGDLVASAGLQSAHGKNVTGVVVDLGRPRPITLVLARGLSGSYVVELSTDGTNYSIVGRSSFAPTAVHPAGRPLARYVRVRSPSGLGESLMTEISVW